MIDYWEATGRLVCDAALLTGLMDKLKKHLPEKGFPIEQVKRDGLDFRGLKIPLKAYEIVQAHMEPVLTEKLMSLSAAGELIWGLSYPEVRDVLTQLPAVVSAAGTPKLRSVSTGYFIALGILINDKNFRRRMEKGDKECVARFPRLKSNHIENLMSIICHPKFRSQMTAFDEFWNEGCGGHLRVTADHLFTPGLSMRADNKVKKAAAGGLGFGR